MGLGEELGHLQPLPAPAHADQLLEAPPHVTLVTCAAVTLTPKAVGPGNSQGLDLLHPQNSHESELDPQGTLSWGPYTWS